jgi:hypothetical protein
MTITPEQRKQFLEEVQAFKEQQAEAMTPEEIRWRFMEDKKAKAQKELDEAKPSDLFASCHGHHPARDKEMRSNTVAFNPEKPRSPWGPCPRMPSDPKFDAIVDKAFKKTSE